MDRSDALRGVVQLKCTGGRAVARARSCITGKLRQRLRQARGCGMHALVQAELRVSCMPCPVYSGASAPPQQRKMAAPSQQQERAVLPQLREKAMRRAPSGPP